MNTPAPKITWGQPPPAEHGGRRGVWADRLAPFRERPGEWGRLVGEWAPGTSHQITRGRMVGVDAGDYEATERKAPSGKTLLWVRYVGGDK